eukprot:jgi/Tetstr1/458260/TSEL_044748.t1
MPKKGKNSFKTHCRRNKRKKPPKQAVLPKDAMTVESGSASAGATDGKPLARCKRCDFERAGGGGPFKKKCEYITNPLPGQTACIVRRKAPAPKKQSQLGSGPVKREPSGLRDIRSQLLPAAPQAPTLPQPQPAQLSAKPARRQQQDIASFASATHALLSIAIDSDATEAQQNQTPLLQAPKPARGAKLTALKFVEKTLPQQARKVDQLDEEMTRACMLKAIDAVREGVAPAHTIPSLQFSRSDGYGAEVTPTAFLMTSGPTPINLYIADFSLVKGISEANALGWCKACSDRQHGQHVHSMQRMQCSSLDMDLYSNMLTDRRGLYQIVRPDGRIDYAVSPMLKCMHCNSTRPMLCAETLGALDYHQQLAAYPCRPHQVTAHIHISSALEDFVESIMRNTSAGAANVVAAHLNASSTWYKETVRAYYSEYKTEVYAKEGTQAAIGVRPFPLDDNILKSTFCASLSADTLLSRWEQGLNVKKRHLIAELVMAHRTSADKPRQGEMVFCIDWSLSWGSVYKLNNGKKGIGVVITNGLGVILWEGVVPTQAIDAIATALTKVVSRDGAAFLVGYIDNMPKGAELLKKAGQVDLMGQDQGHFDRRISSTTNNFCDQYGSFCVELTECFLEYNAIFHKLVEVRLLRPGGLPPKAKFKLANGSTKCFGKNDCITKQELADLKDPSKGRKFYTIFKDSLPRDYRHPEVMAARLVELYRKYENVVDTTGRKLFGKDTKDAFDRAIAGVKYLVTHPRLQRWEQIGLDKMTKLPIFVVIGNTNTCETAFMGLETACSNAMTWERLDLLALDKAVNCNGRKFVKLGIKGIQQWEDNNMHIIDDANNLCAEMGLPLVNPHRYSRHEERAAAQCTTEAFGAEYSQPMKRPKIAASSQQAKRRKLFHGEGAASSALSTLGALPTQSVAAVQASTPLPPAVSILNQNTAELLRPAQGVMAVVSTGASSQVHPSSLPAQLAESTAMQAPPRAATLVGADTTVGLAVGPELLQTWQRQYPDWFKRNTKLDTPEELTKHIHGLARKPALNNTKLPCVCLKPPGIKLRRHEEGGQDESSYSSWR